MFKVGDVVKTPYYGAGVIVKIRRDLWVSVEHFNYLGGHTCDGYAKDGYGWNYALDNLKYMCKKGKKLSIMRT